MKLRLSLREIRLIGAVTLGVIVLCAALVLVSRHVNETFFQTLESSARVSGKIELAGMDRFVIRKKIDAPGGFQPVGIREEPRPQSGEKTAAAGKKTDQTPGHAALPTAPVQKESPPQITASGNTQPPALKAPVPPASEPNEEVAAAPYALHLASCRKEANCRNIVNQFEGSEIHAYTRRVDLGDKGVWHRVYLGQFASRAQARSARQEYNLPEARILKINSSRPPVE